MESRFTEYKNGKKTVTVTKTDPLPCELQVIGVAVPYAWNYSAAFRDLISPRHESPSLMFLEEHTTCHEAAHGILKGHNDFLAAYSHEPIIEAAVQSMRPMGVFDPEDERMNLLNETLAQLTSIKHTERFEPDAAERLETFWSFFKTDQEHMNAVSLVYQNRDVAEKLREEIKNRNSAARAV